MAIDRLLKNYIDGEDARTKRINRCISLDSAVGLRAETIATSHNAVLSTLTGIDIQAY